MKETALTFTPIRKFSALTICRDIPYVVLTYELLSKYICSTKRIHIGLFPKHWQSGQAAGCLADGQAQCTALQCSSSTAWWPSAGLALAAQDSFILFYRLVYARRACAAVHCGALRHGAAAAAEERIKHTMLSQRSYSSSH